MTAREHAFANRMIAGDGPSAAYLNAGYAPQSNNRLIAIAAQRVLNRPAVQERIQAARAKATAAASLSRQDKLELLAKRARTGEALDATGIKAIEVHNAMTGDNAPEEVNVFGLGELLTLVRKKSRKP